MFRALCAIVICLGLVSALQADSIFETSQISRESSQESQSKYIHFPLIQGFKKLSSLYADNFILLEKKEQSPNAQTKRSAIHDEARDKDSNNPTNPNQPMTNNIQQTHNPDIQNLSNHNPSQSTKQKPKVLIIMDDMSQASQIRNLQALKLNIIPSIFPKTKANPQTPQIAAQLAKQNKTYMLHLPLEALNFEQQELYPIKVGSSKKFIESKLAQIKKDFPSLVYINNHTGSKFTQSKQDMRNLLSAIDKYGFKFVDSITISNPASEQLAKEQQKLIMQRDIFLDNTTSVAYTKSQLKILIKKAQKKGYAIAICHPHPTTFKALAQMSKELEDSLELVSPQELESYLRSQSIVQYSRNKFYENDK